MNKKNIIIVGGTGLLGTAISLHLAKLGNNIIVADTNLTKGKKIQKNNKNIILIKCNVNLDRDIDNLIIKSKKLFKKIDTVIYCAYPRSIKWGKSFEKLERKYLNIDLNNHLGSSIIFSQKIIKMFMDQKYGNLIHFSSIQAIGAPKFNHYKGTKMTSPIEYSAMKAGIVSITKYLAKLYKKKNVRVNCISPGGIIDGQSKKFLIKYKADCGTKGMLDPKDILSTVEFLISENSKYITGQNVIVDDGWSL